MAAASLVHWAVVLAILLLVVGVPLAIYRANKRRYPTELKGFGGWMILVAYVVYFAPVHSIVNFRGYMEVVPPAARESFPLLAGGVAVLVAGLLALEVVVAVQMTRRRASFVRWFVWLFAAVFALFPLSVAWVAGVLLVEAGQSFGAAVGACLTSETVGGWLFAVASMGVWTGYVIRSRRVANTFTAV